eukprot:PhF_6_TR42416/c0_g1_i1/m.63974
MGDLTLNYDVLMNLGLCCDLQSLCRLRLTCKYLNTNLDDHIYQLYCGLPGDSPPAPYPSFEAYFRTNILTVYDKWTRPNASRFFPDHTQSHMSLLNFNGGLCTLRAFMMYNPLPVVHVTSYPTKSSGRKTRIMLLSRAEHIFVGVCCQHIPMRTASIVTKQCHCAVLPYILPGCVIDIEIKGGQISKDKEHVYGTLFVTRIWGPLGEFEVIAEEPFEFPIPDDVADERITLLDAWKIVVTPAAPDASFLVL